jgi:hypothetical protein
VARFRIDSFWKVLKRFLNEKYRIIDIPYIARHLRNKPLSGTSTISPLQSPFHHRTWANETYLSVFAFLLFYDLNCVLEGDDTAFEKGEGVIETV